MRFYLHIHTHMCIYIYVYILYLYLYLYYYLKIFETLYKVCKEFFEKSINLKNLLSIRDKFFLIVYCSFMKTMKKLCILYAASCKIYIHESINAIMGIHFVCIFKI